MGRIIILILKNRWEKIAYVLGLDSNKLLELAGYSHTEINMANSTICSKTYFPHEDLNKKNRRL